MRRGHWVLSTLGLITVSSGLVMAQQAEPQRITLVPSEQMDAAAPSTPPSRGGLTIQGSPADLQRTPQRYSRERYQLKHSESERGAIRQAGFETTTSPTGRNNSGVIHAEFEPEAGQSEPIRQTGATRALAAPSATDNGSTDSTFLPAATPRTAQRQTLTTGRVTEIRRAPVARAESQVESNTNAHTPAVSVKWARKSEVNVGQECQIELIVHNHGQIIATDFEVEAHFPGSVRLTQTTPKPDEVGRTLTWKIPVLAPGERQVIDMRLIPSRRGPIATNALVRFSSMASSEFEVLEPMLKVALEGPQQVMIGEPATQMITISNPGTGLVRNVQIEAAIPEGLEHPRGERLAMDIGNLSPGETRRVRLSLVAIGGGTHPISVKAAGDSDLTRIVSSKIHVVAPSLAVAIDGPGLRYLGRTAKFDINIKNDGTVSSDNVRAKYKIPEGYGFVRAEQGGKYDPATKTVNWFIGGLEPQETRQVAVVLTSKQLGSFSHQAVAVSEHGAQSVSQFDSRVEGSASLVLDIADGNDPVEIGATTSYTIRISNEGSKAAQNVGVSCELPAAVKLVSASGPTDYIAENGLIVFKSLPQVDPNQTAVYEIKVQGTSEGNHRVRARLASDSIREPLIFEELTRFYAGE